jgi:hypothetical protein
MANEPGHLVPRMDSASIARRTFHADLISARVAYRQAHPWPAEGAPVHPRVIAAAASAAKVMTPLKWPHGVRYEHWNASMYPIANEDSRRQMRWMKSVGVVGLMVLTDGNAGQGPLDGDSGWGFAQLAVQEGLDVVVRYYRSVEHGWTDAMTKATERYVSIGVNKVQTTNEPDLLGVEWSGKVDPKHWLEVAFDYWMRDAHMINSLGAWAVTPPMASGVFRQRGEGAGYWGPDLNPFLWCKEQGLQIIGGLHAYLLNHPADYPADDVNQKGAPLTIEDWRWASENGRWSQAWGSDSLAQVNAWRASDANPGDTLINDDACGRVFEIYEDKLNAAGYTDADLFSGEGWAVNMNRQDRRYPGLTPPVMLANNLAHFRYLGQHPRYRGNAAWIFESGSGGWGSDQHHHPGVPEANGDGYLFAVAGLAAYPAASDFATPPVPDPTPEPIPPEEEPVPEPVVVNDAVAYGVTILPINVEPGDHYWKAVRVHHLTPQENNGQLNVFVSVLDASGKRIPGMPVASTWVGKVGGPEFAVQDKPLTDMGGCNFLLSNVRTIRSVWVPGEVQSEIVGGMHTNHPVEGPVTGWGHEGNGPGHTSFLVEFQDVICQGAVTPPPDPTPMPADTWTAQDRADLQEAQNMLSAVRLALTAQEDAVADAQMKLQDVFDRHPAKGVIS